MTLDRHGVAILMVSKAGIKDCGTYTITAANEVGQVTQSAKVTMADRASEIQPETVHGLSRPPIFIKKPRSLEAVESDCVTLVCEVEGNPKPDVIWHRDWLNPDYYLGKERFHRDGEGNQYTLQIPCVRLEDTGAYSVIAKNVHGEAKAIISLQIYAKGQGKEEAMDYTSNKQSTTHTIPAFTQKLQNLRCCDGDSIIFECRVQSQPKPNVRWEKAGSIVEPSAEFEQEQDGDILRLKIQSVYPEDEGLYTCTVYTDTGKAITSAFLTVDSAEEKENDASVQLGDGAPTGLLVPPSSVKPGSRAYSAPAGSPTRTRRREVTRPRYRLKAIAPKFYTIPHNKIVEVGENVKFSCTVAGHPMPRVSWDKDGTPISPSNKKYVLEDVDDFYTIEIQSVTHEDSGLYRVTVENDLGKQQATARLEIMTRTGPRITPRIHNLGAPRYHPSPHDRRHGYSRGRPGFGSIRCGSLPPSSGYFRRYSAMEEENENDAKEPVQNSTEEKKSYGTSSAREQRPVEGAPTFIEGLSDSTATEGEPLRLSVNVQGKKPMKVLWVKDSRRLPNCRYFKQESSEDGQYSLYISDVFKEDEGEYTCEAYNAAGEAETKANIQVRGIEDLSPCAPTLEEGESDLEIEEGKSRMISMRARGVPTPTVTWEINTKKIKNSPRFKLHSNGDQHTLEIIHALATDSGCLTCRAANSKGETSHTTSLFVSAQLPSSKDTPEHPPTTTPELLLRTTPELLQQTTPEVHLQTTPEREHTRELLSNATPELRTEENKIIVSSSEDSGVKSSETSDGDTDVAKLHVGKNGLLDQTSNHLCHGRSRSVFAPSVSHVLTSDVHRSMSITEQKELPAAVVQGPQSITVLLGETATLRCHYIGSPEPTVRWMKGGKEVIAEDRITIENVDGVSSLTIRTITADDSGKYVVIVENSGRTDCHFASLAVEGPPNPPAGKPHRVEMSDKSVTLAWYGSTYDGGSIVTGYVIEMKEKDDEIWSILTPSCHSTSYVVRDLIPGRQYQFRVRAQNVHGLSEASQMSNVVCLPSSPVGGEDEEEDAFQNEEHRQVEITDGSEFSQQYDVCEEIGKGKFGVVYRVVHSPSGRVYAAKKVKWVRSADKQKVHDEINIMNLLKHPKLLQLVSAFEKPRETILVMEYISGGELFERVVADDFTLTERDCILFMRQICDGVSYMHKSNIVHLDLKPENILCQTKTSHKVKLIDFGLARQIKPDEMIRVMFGTPEFIAPEVINYEPIGFASDMWSVGIICYVLLSGLSPFMGDTDVETYANITKADYDFEDEAFDEISQDAKDFIMNLLLKRPEKRLTSEQCLQHKWLAQHETTMKSVKLSTDKLKKYLIKRKWQKTGNAIRAVVRMDNMTSRRGSGSNSPRGSLSGLNNIPGSEKRLTSLIQTDSSFCNDRGINCDDPVRR